METAKLNKKITKEGLVIPMDVLKSLGLEKDVDIITKKHSILIKPKSLTERVKGIVKKTPLSSEELEELYHEYKGF